LILLGRTPLGLTGGGGRRDLANDPPAVARVPLLPGRIGAVALGALGLGPSHEHKRCQPIVWFVILIFRPAELSELRLESPSPRPRPTFVGLPPSGAADGGLARIQGCSLTCALLVQPSPTRTVIVLSGRVVSLLRRASIRRSKPCRPASVSSPIPSSPRTRSTRIVAGRCSRTAADPVLERCAETRILGG